jgi:hypothetical protein
MLTETGKREELKELVGRHLEEDQRLPAGG